jgi:MFS transporter, FSR family, fosmidomycin resistance protein
MNARSAKLAVLFANFGHVLTHMLMLLYPTVVLALEGSYGLTYGELLALSMPGYVLFGVAALPAGWLSDRWSPEHMMVIFFVGSGAAAILTGFANGPVGLTVGLGLIGLFCAIYHPVGVAWLVRNSENRGRTLGWNGIFGSIGAGISSFVAGSLTDLATWRAAFIVPGIITVLGGIALAILVRGEHVVALKTDLRPQPEPQRADVRRAFIVLSVTMLLSGLIWQMLTVALPKLFDVRLTGLTNGGVMGTGGFVSLVFISSAAVQIVGGWLADRYSLRLVYVLAWAAQIPVLLIAVRMAELPLLATMILLFSLDVMTTPAENSLLVRYTPGRWRATAFGAKYLLALGVSALGVPLVGVLFDASGDFVSLFLILAAAAAAITVAALFLPREEARAAAPAAVPAE